MTTKTRNETHDYELAELPWAVVQPFNGGTDWNTLAAFAFGGDADKWADEWNKEYKDAGLAAPYEVRHIGTAHDTGPGLDAALQRSNARGAMSTATELVDHGDYAED